MGYVTYMRPLIKGGVCMVSVAYTPNRLRPIAAFLNLNKNVVDKIRSDNPLRGDSW